MLYSFALRLEHKVVEECLSTFASTCCMIEPHFRCSENEAIAEHEIRTKGFRQMTAQSNRLIQCLPNTYITGYVL